MSTCNKKICIQCKIKPIVSGNRKLYCDKCFVTVKLSKKNKVDIMKPIIEETDNNIKNVITQQYIPHRIEDILPKSYLELMQNTHDEHIKELETEITYYKHLVNYYYSNIYYYDYYTT
jgi:hypothetical protein